jgi:hypothetical protein
MSIHITVRCDHKDPGGQRCDAVLTAPYNPGNPRPVTALADAGWMSRLHVLAPPGQTERCPQHISQPNTAATRTSNPESALW